MLPLAAGTAVAIGSLAGSAMGQTYTWIGGATGNFSVNANWLGGVGPGAGTGSATTALNFNSGNGAVSITATNNNGSPFVVNSMTFNSFNPATNTFSVAGGSATGQFQMAGSSAFINNNGIGDVSLANGTSSPNWGAQLQLNANVTFGGTGFGRILVGSTSNTGVSEIGGPRSITVSGGAANPMVRNVVFNGNNAFTGGLILDGGTAQLGSSGALNALGSGTMTVTSNGGYFNMAQFQSTLGLSGLQLNGDLHVIGNNTFTLANGSLTAPAVVQGSGTLYMSTAGGGMTIQSNSNAYSGAVVIAPFDFGAGGAFTSVGVMTLSTVAGPAFTAGGSLTGAASYDVSGNGTLTASSSTANSVQNGDRINDNAPVRFRTGNFILNGPAAAVTTTSGNNYVPTNLTEKIGDLTGAGHDTIAVNPTASTNVITTLDMKSLTRQDRGTFNFRSNAATMGDGATATRGRIILDTPLAGTEFVGGGGAGGSKNISILPYAVGSTSTSDGGSGFVTYGADGFRMLTAAEYDLDPAGLTPGSPDNNVKLDATITNNAPQTMNSLLLAKGGTVDGMVAGTGTLNITSGAVLSAGAFGTNTANQQTIANNLAFGSAEGLIFTGGGGGLRITGQLSGSNGMTKSGNGTSTGSNVLVLTADNSNLTGPLTLNSGGIQYNQDLALPGTGTIVSNGAGVSSSGSSPTTYLMWAGTVDTTLSRNVQVNPGALSFKIFDTGVSTQVNLGNMHLTGTISGTGNVNFQGQVTGSSVTTPGEIWVDNTNNTYTGITQFSGNTHLAADGSTGVGGAWYLSTGTVYFESSVTNSRSINVGSVALDTKGHDVTLNGPITAFSGGSFATPGSNSGSITKNGLGALTLTNTLNQLAGTMTVNAGSLVINGNLGMSGTSNVIVSPGAFLGGTGTIYRNVQGFSTVTGTKGGGMISPGSSTAVGNPGILTIWGAASTSVVPALNLANTITNGGGAATLMMDLNGPAAGTGYDQIMQMAQNQTSVVTVNLGGSETPNPTTLQANLALSLGYAPSASDVFWLIVNSNTQGSLQAVPNTTIGSFAGMPEGSTVTLGTFGGNTYTGTISYKGDYDSNNPAAGTGNDVVIYNVVPAPGSIALLGIGGLLAARRKRRMA
jgi:autotransporter-associated beta strand protein